MRLPESGPGWIGLAPLGNRVRSAPIPPAYCARSIRRDEYKKGLDAGGVLGGAICRGVISAAEDYGVELDAIVDEYRNDRQRKRLSDGERNREQLGYIGMRVPEPPFDRPASQKVAMAGFTTPQNPEEEGTDTTGRKRLFANKPAGHVSRDRGGLPTNVAPQQETPLERKRKSRSKSRNSK